MTNLVLLVENIIYGLGGGRGVPSLRRRHGTYTRVREVYSEIFPVRS